MAVRPSQLFFLPNTTTILARSAINLLRSANQALLDEAITTLQNRNLSALAVMNHLEQNVNFAEVLEKLAKDWSPETQRVFAGTLNMDPARTDVMDLIVAIGVLNEADLEAELRSENTPQTTTTDLLENRRITWQYPPPGTILDPPYIVLVAVEQVDTAKADSEAQTILGELVDYKGYKIPRRTFTPFKPLPGALTLRPDLLSAITATAIQPENAVTTPAAASSPVVTQPTAADMVNSLGRIDILSKASRFSRGL